MLSSGKNPYKIVYKETEEDRQDGRILEQIPPAGEKAFHGQSLILTVGKWKEAQGEFRTLILPISAELHQKRIRVVLFDRRGKTILFEGRAIGRVYFSKVRV